jgi:hypothetical protein
LLKGTEVDLPLHMTRLPLMVSIRPQAASSVPRTGRGMFGWVRPPSGNRASRVGCGAPEPILSLSAGGEGRSQLVYRFQGLIPRILAFCVCCAGSSFRPPASAALTVCYSKQHELSARALCQLAMWPWFAGAVIPSLRSSLFWILRCCGGAWGYFAGRFTDRWAVLA